MKLRLDDLEKPRLRGGKIVCRCPACAEVGGDNSCEHLIIMDEGRGPFGCIMFPGPAGGAHRRRIWELAATSAKDRYPRLLTRPTAQKSPDKASPRIPALRRLHLFEMVAIQTLRGWPAFAGMELLSRRGLFWHGTVWDDGHKWPAWIVTDATRRNAQARRLDGQPWTGIGNAKAKTLPGCDPSWPIGAAEMGDRSLIVVCEGGPDFLAALLVAWWEGLNVQQIAPVCMTGAGNTVHPAALPLFSGKHVRIAVHADKAGRDAGENWARQFYDTGASRVDGFDFGSLKKCDGVSVKDLADFATLIGLEIPAPTRVFDGLPHIEA